ncbi:glycosyltransferase family 2 protein [Williamsia sterculiae]|uniref:glycosyltransferase family 2 protein n=1 Tax=Williamsia sterculiae TaxID=1344003 RepID=UPI0009707491|nr:glycosyltransferase family 2 protein [Williamsia sterculiae]
MARPNSAGSTVASATTFPTFSVVIPIYNEEVAIRHCLDRLTAQIDDITEIVVVDNNSTDDGMSVVAEFRARFPQIRVVTATEQGLVHARNVGLDAAAGDLIARIDADTRVPEQWARTIIDFFVADGAGEWASMCGRGEAYGLPFAGRFDRWKIAIHPLSKRRAHRTVTELPVLYGSNMVLRRETWHRIRDRVSMRRDIFEDVDMGLCVTETGGRNAFLADLTVGVSPRRMESPMGEFVRYMSFLPRTFALHRRYGFTVGSASVYLPALVVMHAGRLMMFRLYDPEVERFTVRKLFTARSGRVLP